LFPLYWTSNPCVIKGVDERLLTTYESEVVDFLDSFSLFEIKELLDLETDYPSLVAYLCKLFRCLFILFTCYVSAYISMFTGLLTLSFPWCRKNEDSFS
jgi:hypothetical protein